MADDYSVGEMPQGSPASERPNGSQTPSWLVDPAAHRDRWAAVLSRAMSDPSFRLRLKEFPVQTLQDADIVFAENARITVTDFDPNEIAIVLPPSVVPEGSPNAASVPNAPPVSFAVNWAGVVAILDHSAAQTVDTAADGAAAFLGLGGATATAIALLPGFAAATIATAGAAAIALGIFAAYCAAEKWLIGVTDRGNGVYLTLPWFAIAAGQFWVIVPTSR